MGEKQRKEILCQLKRTSSQSLGGGAGGGRAGEMGSHKERVQDRTSERGWVQNELERQAGVQLRLPARNRWGLQRKCGGTGVMLQPRTGTTENN